MHEAKLRSHEMLAESIRIMRQEMHDKLAKPSPKDKSVSSGVPEGREKQTTNFAENNTQRKTPRVI